MTGIPTAEKIEAAKAALHAHVEDEARKPAGSFAGEFVGGALDIAGRRGRRHTGEAVVLPELVLTER